MTPAPQGEEVALPRDGNQVVISGMSGLYPKSRYVRDLENVLYNKINPITSDNMRWSYNHPEAAQYAGNVPDLDRFDAQFFKVHYRLANNMDFMARKILEQTYEAIYDAGNGAGCSRSRAYMHKCGWRVSPACDCGASVQDVALIIKDCPLTKYVGNPADLNRP